MNNLQTIYYPTSPQFCIGIEPRNMTPPFGMIHILAGSGQSLICEVFEFFIPMDTSLKYHLFLEHAALSFVQPLLTQFCGKNRMAKHPTKRETDPSTRIWHLLSLVVHIDAPK